LPYYVNGVVVNEYFGFFEIHRWNNPLFPFSFHDDMITAGSCIGDNWHESLEILQVTDGEGTLLCDSKTYSISAGDIVVINSNEVHKVTSDTSIRYDCFIIGASFLSENGLDITKLKYTTIINDERLEQLLSIAFAEYSNHADPTKQAFFVPAVRVATLNAILYLSCKYSGPFVRKGSNTSSEVIRTGLRYINSNFTKQITLEEIARSVGVSKYHFLREFKRYTDHTVVTYINILRCEYAKHLFGSSKASVGEVAHQCGFTNLSYFTKTFKKYTGHLPSHYYKATDKKPAHDT